MSIQSLSAKVGETLNLTFDFTADLEIKWRDLYQQSAGDFITVGSFIYECTDAGKTDYQQPEWPTAIGTTVDDGSVQWTCRDYSTAGSDTITAIAVPSVTGVTVDSSAIDLGTRVDVTVTITADGSHELECEVTTAAGETLKKDLSVVVD